MDQPQGFEKRGAKGGKLHCYLLKSLYGLKQAGRNWRIMLNEFLMSVGFISLKSDMRVFKRDVAGESSMFVVGNGETLCGNRYYAGSQESCFVYY